MEFQSYFQEFLCINATEYLLMESMTLVEPSRSAGGLARHVSGAR